MGLFGGIFSKDIQNTSSTSNQDNSRITTLTDSLNTSLVQNTNMTRADSRVYNSAFDAIDSFNTVNSYEIQNIGGGGGAIPTLDFTGLRSLFTNPADLSALINSNHIDADPNANKYNFDFAATSAGGNDFLKAVQDLTRSSWEGLTNATTAAKSEGGTETGSMVKWAIIAAVVLGFGFIILKLFKK